MINNLKSFLNEDQDPKAVEKVVDKLKSLLMSGEEITYIAVQQKPAINLNPDCIALTNKRVIFCRSKNLGLSMEFQDFVWPDVADCHLKENMLGSEFSVRTAKGEFDKIDYLPKNQARSLYAMAQEQEEKQREFRRQQELEERRAGAAQAAQAVPPLPSAPPPVASAPPAPDELMVSLQKLKTLFEHGLITQEEFESKKAEILSRL
jgi:hypothetical protein